MAIAPAPKTGILGKLFGAVVILLVVGYIANEAGYGTTTSPGSLSLGTTPTRAPAAANRQPVTASGSGVEKSSRFRLQGDYAVRWLAKAPDASGCYHGANLERADGTFMNELLVNEVIADAAQHSGATNVYGLASADYYIDASGCEGSWSFTFTPN